jgi:ABC-type glycerol-3-phosphate transport system substrate-binding protein
MRKYFILILGLCGTFYVGSAQSKLPEKEDINSFFNTKTLIVLEGGFSSFYNAYIKDAVKKDWEITPFEFIKADEFENKMSDSTYSFLVLTNTHFEKDKADADYNFINLLLGKKGVKNITEMPEMGSLPLSYTDNEDDDYSYKLSVIIQFLQKRAELMKDRPDFLSMRYLKYYNKNTPEVKLKTLWVLKKNLASEINTIDKIRKTYPYDIKIVTEDELEDAIADKKDYLFLHCVMPEEKGKQGWTFKMIFGITDGRLYYYNKHTISQKKPAGLLKSDLKKMMGKNKLF